MTQTSVLPGIDAALIRSGHLVALGNHTFIEAYEIVCKGREDGLLTYEQVIGWTVDASVRLRMGKQRYEKDGDAEKAASDILSLIPSE